MPPSIDNDCIDDIVLLGFGHLMANPTRDCLYVEYLYKFSLVEGASCDASLTKLKNYLLFVLLEVLNLILVQELNQF